MQNFNHNIGFREKRHFFRRKLSEIAEKCDRNIGLCFFATGSSGASTWKLSHHLPTLSLHETPEPIHRSNLVLHSLLIPTYRYVCIGICKKILQICVKLGKSCLVGIT
jgi:hypothetical protein